MTIASEIKRIKTNISNAYTKAEEKGATLPVEKNSDNLASTISTIKGGGGDKVIAQISAPMASPLAEGDKVWIEKNTGAAGAVYKHSGGRISAGRGPGYNGRIYKIGDVFTNSYTSSSSYTFYLAKYDKESQKFYYGGSHSAGNYFFYSINNKQRLKGILYPDINLHNRYGFYYNGSSFTSFASACRDIFTGNNYRATSSSSDYAFCVDQSATDPTTQKNWCIVKIGLENGSFSQEVTASGYTTDMNVTQIETLFGTEDYCFARYGGYSEPQQNSTVLKVDFINGTVEPYTFIGLGGTGSIILRYIHEDQFVITSDGVKYKITIDDSAKTITFTDGVVVENPPEGELSQANDCENIFYVSGGIYYWVDNPTDFDTISFKKIYTVTQGAASSQQPPVFATDNKLFCAGVLLSENGGVVDTNAITEPLTAIYYISDGGYVTTYQNVLKLGVGAFSYSTGGTKVSSITSPFFPIYWCFNGNLFYDRPVSYPCRVYIRDNLGFIRKEDIGVWWDSSNSYATGIVRGNLFGSMWDSATIVQPTIKEVQEDGSIIAFTVTRSPWSPTNTRYDANIYWEGNDIYARVGNSGALKGTIDWENKTIDWGESMYLTGRTTVQTLQTLYRTYDDLYDIGKGGVYEYNKETCQYVLKTPWSDEIITTLGGSPTTVQVLNDKHINLVRQGKSVLIKYDDTGIENAEIMATLNLEDYIGPFSTQSSDGTGWLYSFNREYVTLVTSGSDITDNDATNICFKLGDSPYEYNVFKPSYTNLNSNWLTGKFTGNQGTDENGRRYVEVATVLPEESS